MTGLAENKPHTSKWQQQMRKQPVYKIFTNSKNVYTKFSDSPKYLWNRLSSLLLHNVHRVQH